MASRAREAATEAPPDDAPPRRGAGRRRLRPLAQAPTPVGALPGRVPGRLSLRSRAPGRECAPNSPLQVRGLSEARSGADLLRARGRRAFVVCVGSVTVAASVAFAAGCSRNDADPGNARLNAMQKDRAFALAPPGGTLIGESSEEARRAPLSKTYLGPRVSRSYQFSGDAAEARRFYTALNSRA